ncbi:MAG: hypothetical protein CMF62_01105 [Magnetococcales bacterium]|nr:hypothetical protein [Magnetococcales bacterium]|tara:strand:- start:192 stop:1034 length:843 start_codon:yes stop_codon:yes gene_type:complete
MNYKINYIKSNIKKLNLTQVLLIILILFLVYIHFIKKVPILEGMSGAVNPEALANLSAMYNNGKLKVSSLEVTGDTNLKGKANIDGKITCKGGGDFSSKDSKYLFSDLESGGKKLRVGNPWGHPGIYSESGSLTIGSQSRDIFCGGPKIEAVSARLFSAEVGAFKGGHEHAWLGYGNGSRFQKSISGKKLFLGVAGYGIDGSGTTHLLHEGTHNLSDIPYSNDLWDNICAYPGWEILVATDYNLNGSKQVIKNNSPKPVYLRLNPVNKASSYKATWVGIK